MGIIGGNIAAQDIGAAVGLDSFGRDAFLYGYGQAGEKALAGTLVEPPRLFQCALFGQGGKAVEPALLDPLIQP